MSSMPAIYSESLNFVNSVLHIPQFRISLSNGDMETVTEHRRFWLEKAISECGSAEALSALATTSAQYISQVRNGSPDSKTGKPREVGKALARKIERAMKWPEGRMDQPPELTAPDSEDYGELTTALHQMDADIVLFRNLVRSRRITGALLAHVRSAIELANNTATVTERTPYEPAAVTSSPAVKKSEATA